MLAESVFKSPVLSWRTNDRYKNKIEILLKNSLPFTAENYNLDNPTYRTVTTEYADFHLTYYGFLVSYYMASHGGSIPNASSDKTINCVANESLKDVWINGVRWGIDTAILEIILEESAAQKFTEEERCICCGIHLPYEEVVRKRTCKRCTQYQRLWNEAFHFNTTQKLYIAKGAQYKIENHRLFTDSHVVIREHYKRKPTREVLRGHIHPKEELIEVK